MWLLGVWRDFHVLSSLPHKTVGDWARQQLFNRHCREIIDKVFWDPRLIIICKFRLPFIFSPLHLVPKHDSGWRKIHHLSYPQGHSVNDHIPDEAGEMRYPRFQDTLQLVILAGRRCIIMKRDVKDAFRNIRVAPQHQWLLGFLWREKHYKEIYLSLGFSAAPLMFNMFGEVPHYIAASNASQVDTGSLSWQLHSHIHCSSGDGTKDAKGKESLHLGYKLDGNTKKRFER